MKLRDLLNESKKIDLWDFARKAKINGKKTLVISTIINKMLAGKTIKFKEHGGKTIKGKVEQAEFMNTARGYMISIDLDEEYSPHEKNTGPGSYTLHKKDSKVTIL